MRSTISNGVYWPLTLTFTAFAFSAFGRVLIDFNCLKSAENRLFRRGTGYFGTCQFGIFTSDNILKLTDGQFENAKIKDKNTKLWNPDFFGMAMFYYLLFYRISCKTMSYVKLL